MRLVLVLTAVLLLGWSAHAAQPATVMQESDAVKVIFDEIAKKTIRDYFGDKDAADDGDDDIRRDGVRRIPGQKSKKRQGLPPGLAKRDTLPPGLQKQLERNGTLPPGLQARALPGDLERRLPALPDGVERGTIADDVVLIEKATGRILDILKDVLNRPAG
jgi:hypothetical protein